MYNKYTKIMWRKSLLIPSFFIIKVKVTIILLLVGFLQVQAISYGQVVSLDMKNASLEDIFSQLRKQSGYNFLYDYDVISRTNKVSITTSAISLREMLDKCLKGQSIDYVIKDNNVVIRKKALNKEKEKLLQHSISGRVRDEQGKPIAGVTILIKGSTAGTTSDSEGKYSIQGVSERQILIFKSLNYETQEIVVTNQAIIDVVLKEQISSLNEVVVIGYGTQRRKDVTGAVSSVKGSDLNISTSSNFAQALQGKASGIQVTQSTGQPGAGVDIKVRSNPSNANPGTLYVIDGIVVNNSAETPNAAKYGNTGLSQSPLNFINPNDIESIEVLKDASARAIYGAQAGGGVVLITTKKGKSGTPTLQYSGSYAAQKVDKMYEVLGTKVYMEQRNLLAEEMYLQKNKIAPFYGTVDGASLAPFQPIFTQDQIEEALIQPNAMDAITRNGYTQQHNLSLSAKSGKTNYYISGNYFDQKGVIVGTDYKRWNGRVNLDQQISDRFKIGINLIGSNSKSKNAVTGGQFENGGIITAAMYYPANMQLQNPDGSYPLNPNYTNIPNPLSFSTITDDLKNQRLLAATYGQWEIIDGLVAKANFSYDQGSIKRYSYLPTSFSYGAQVGGMAGLSSNGFDTKQIDYTINYKVPLSPIHSLDLLAGYTYQLQNKEGLSAGNQKFTSDIISYFNLNAGQADKPSVGSSRTQTTYASYFGRAIYQLYDKYTFQASIRRDGSSRFAENHKWGYFPGVSAGWNISDEDFLKENEHINLLKLRAGYGEIGNANFPASAFEVYGLRSNPNFGSGTASTGIFLTQAANPDLKWETAAEFNVGLDFSLYKERVSGSIDYFDKTIRDLITYVPFPADFTVSGVYSNAGKTKSQGYEISLQTKNFRSNDAGGFNWSSTINLSHYLSYWTERSPQALATLSKYVIPTGKNALFNGIYGYQATGQLYDGTAGQLPSHMAGMLPGGIILNDIHGYDTNGNLTAADGKITDADQTLLGNADPKFNIGFGNSFSFKNFDLNIFLSGVVQKAWSPYAPNGNYRIASLAANMGTYGWNTMPVSLDRWSFKNTEGTFPSGLADPLYASYQANSSYYLVNASYLRCQNITLGYTVPTNWLSKQKTFSSLRFSFDVQNAFVITKYPDLDPQLAQNNFYPLSKSFVFGLNATF